uniref:Uncharacterized protein n=1 Tax=Arundo donax TaxID=35708 RepID=A0A0A9FE38_ARUDO
MSARAAPHPPLLKLYCTMEEPNSTNTGRPPSILRRPTLMLLSSLFSSSPAGRLPPPPERRSRAIRSAALHPPDPSLPSLSLISVSSYPLRSRRSSTQINLQLVCW